MTDTKITETSVEIVRRLDAPVERVWEAFADPEVLGRWFAPGTRRCDIHTWDFQEGGAFHVTFVPTEDDGYGPPSPARGTFSQVRPRERIVLTWNWDFEEAAFRGPEGRIEIELRKTNEGTELTFAHRGLPNKEAVGAVAGGWGTTLPKLDEVLA